MAGHGPTPKDPSKRIGRGAPMRGDWRDLRPIGKGEFYLPMLPREHNWNLRTKKLWAAWRKDPVTQVFGPSEIAMCIELAYLVEKAIAPRAPAAVWGEVRQWMDRLGLTPKGKQDLRYRIIDGLTPVEDQPAPELRRKGLRAIG